ncbi:MAG: hypothetical protein ACOX9E_08480 [Lentisphaeria bacterium]
MKMLCPHCGNALPPEAVNVATDLALCPECGQANRASVCVVEDEINQDLLRRPPPGTWLRQEGGEIVVGASMRSKSAWRLGFFTAFWGGISMFVGYGTQILERNFDLVRTLSSIPFLLVTVFLAGITIYMIFGRHEWHLDAAGGSGFNGVGRFGKRWRFAWKELTRIHIQSFRDSEGEISTKLILEGASPRVEVILPEHEDRQQFIVNAIRYYHQQWRRRE